MKQLLSLIALFSIASTHPYAFVHGSKSDLEKVAIYVDPEGPWGKSGARHLAMRGNRGRGAEWNWKSIAEQTRFKKGDKVPFIISAGSDSIYKGEIPSDGRFGFVVKRSKDPRTNFDMYTVVPDQEAANEYRPA